MSFLTQLERVTGSSVAGNFKKLGEMESVPAPGPLQESGGNGVFLVPYRMSSGVLRVVLSRLHQQRCKLSAQGDGMFKHSPDERLQS